jgi:hypothetical protein
MSTRWTIGRAVASALAVLFLGFGSKFLVDGHRGARSFEEWKTARPMDGVVDLSAPGQFSLPFDQTCSSAHGQVVGLRLPPEILQNRTITQLLAGLQARLEITSRSSGDVLERADSRIVWAEDTLDGAILIFGLASFPRESYEATITVVEGAPALSGIPQRLEGRYLLCGLERLPAIIDTVAGVGVTGIGAIIGAAVLFLMVRERRNTHIGQPDVPPKGGPTTSLGNASIPGGPPSVSLTRHAS